MKNLIKHRLYFTVVFIFFLQFTIANAQIIINEVQISPIDERFIELYNTGSLDIDLTGWYLQRKTATGSSFGSLVTSSNFENKTIKAGEYFLISRNSASNTDIVLNTLTITESNTIRLRNSEREDVDYIELGNIAEGESYQRISSDEWVTALPTPGFANLDTNNDDQLVENESSQTQLDNSNSPLPASDFPIEQQIFVNAGQGRDVIVGADSLFEGKSFGLEKKPLKNARYLWNFGNGETKEGQNVLHYYQYPGEYVVMLNVSSGEYSALDRIIVNAYPADIVISKVEDDFVELYNKSNKELNLSWWQIQSAGERFTLPKDTIILPNKKLIFSKSITELNTSIRENVVLLYPNGVEAVAFEQVSIPQKVVVTKKALVKPQVVVVEREEPVVEEENDILVRAAIRELGIEDSNFIGELVTLQQEEEERFLFEEEAQGQVGLVLRMPTDAPAGDYTLEVTIEYNRGHSVVTETRTIFVQGAKEEAEVETILNIDTTTKQAQVGEEVIYTVTIANLGTEKGVYSLSLDGLGTSLEGIVQPGFLTVLPDSTGQVTISVTPTEDAEARDYAFVANILLGTEVINQINLRTKVLKAEEVAQSTGVSAKTVLGIVFVVLVLVLIVLGVVIAFRKDNGDENGSDDGSAAQAQTYYTYYPPQN